MQAVPSTEPAAEDDGQAPFQLRARQPWANKVVASAKPTEEEMAWLLEQGIIKEDEPEKDVSDPLFFVD